MGKKIENIGPDTPIATNEKGGQQSETPYRFDLIDGKAEFVLAGVLGYGATRYAVNNWRLISLQDHLKHALQHIFAYFAGDRQDDHLGHAYCRIHFAVAMREAGEEYDALKLPDQGGE